MAGMDYTLPDGTPEYVEHIVSALESQCKLNDAWQRMYSAYAEETERLWKDNSALRDDLHAVANRLEALTAFVTSNPAEVAAKIVTDANRGMLREVRDDD